MYTLKWLTTTAGEVSKEINGLWVPARPEPPFGWFGLKRRVSAAYAVLTGKADAFTWPEGQ